MASRYHYLDAARGILMILGIAYHAARVYADTEWIVNDAVTSPVFTALSTAVRSFRMPAFFLMSGFFAGLTLRKYGARQFLARRMPRIVIPFCSTLLTLNVLQTYVLNEYQGGTLATLVDFALRPFRGEYPLERWISHLWFLVCLAFYFAGTAGVAAALGARGRQALASRAGTMTALVTRPDLLLAVLPVLSLLTLALFAAAPVLYRVRLLIDLYTIVEYSPFFAVGLLTFANPRCLAALTTFSPKVLLLTAGAVLFTWSGFTLAGPMGARVLTPYVHALLTWIAIYWVMVGFKAVLDRPSKWAEMLADGSYTIYLFHHLAVILFAWALLRVDISIFLKFLIVTMATFAVTFALHFGVIRRVPLLSLVFNGRPPHGREAARAVA